MWASKSHAGGDRKQLYFYKSWTKNLVRDISSSRWQPYFRLAEREGGGQEKPGPLMKE